MMDPVDLVGLPDPGSRPLLTEAEGVKGGGEIEEEALGSGPGGPEVLAEVRSRLRDSGAKQRMKEKLTAKLVDCGWKDELRAACRKIVKQKNPATVTVDEIIREITPTARASVPNAIKAEMLKDLKVFVHSETQMQ